MPRFFAKTARNYTTMKSWRKDGMVNDHILRNIAGKIQRYSWINHSDSKIFTRTRRCNTRSQCFKDPERTLIKQDLKQYYKTGKHKSMDNMSLMTRHTLFMRGTTVDLVGDSVSEQWKVESNAKAQIKDSCSSSSVLSDVTNVTPSSSDAGLTKMAPVNDVIQYKRKRKPNLRYTSDQYLNVSAVKLEHPRMEGQQLQKTKLNDSQIEKYCSDQSGDTSHEIPVNEIKPLNLCTVKVTMLQPHRQESEIGKRLMRQIIIVGPNGVHSTAKLLEDSQKKEADNLKTFKAIKDEREEFERIKNENHVLVHDHHGNVLHQCKVCEKNLLAMSAFTSHIRSHFSYNKQCRICGKTFARSWLLQGHMRTHTGERPYKCDFGDCGKAFADRSNLRSHRMIHSVKSKDYVCQVCYRAFAQKRYLHKHQLEVCKK